MDTLPFEVVSENEAFLWDDRLFLKIPAHIVHQDADPRINTMLIGGTIAEGDETFWEFDDSDEVQPVDVDPEAILKNFLQPTLH